MPRYQLSAQDLKVYHTCPACEKMDNVEFDVRARLPSWKTGCYLAYHCKGCNHKWVERAGTTGIENGYWKEFVKLKAAHRNRAKPQPNYAWD